MVQFYIGSFENIQVVICNRFSSTERLFLTGIFYTLLLKWNRELYKKFQRYYASKIPE